MSDLIKYDVTDGIAKIVLNRPEVHNALSGEMMETFVSVCELASNDSQVKVILLTGAGPKSFCSGADLGNMAGNENNSILDFKKHVTKYRDCLLAIHHLKKPIIAAVNGYALAGGLGLVAACDLSYATASAQFGAPEINVGLWGMMISSSLKNVIGTKNTFELMYTGQRINTEKARQMGLINDYFSDDVFEEEVYKMAKKLSQKNPVALTHGRESMQMIQNMDYEQSLTYLRDQVVVLSRTEDYREGLLAFREKREPVWSGR